MTTASPTAKDRTRRRLVEIEEELRTLSAQREDLKKRWETEKLHIQTIRSLKSELERVRVESEDVERSGDYAKVAELRYGKLPELDRQLAEANSQLVELQKGTALLKEEIGAADIADIVARWTGIPVQKMLESERSKLLTIEDKLHERVIGQEEAVSAVSSAVRRSRAGLQDRNRPIGSFIFLGSTGVGKTEMARALAEFLFDDEQALVRVDMSEYMEKHSVSRLVGAPPGYVGYEEGGQLTEAIRRRPYSVVLLDEIEKAHPDVFNILLQVLDDGRLTDGQGRVVNFTNTIVVMTSNLGSEILHERLKDITDENRTQIMNEIRLGVYDVLKRRLRPEFLNRIDETIVFQPLTQAEVEKIARIQLNAVEARMAELGYGMRVTDRCVEWIAKRGFDIQFGARPLKRVVQKYVSDPLAIKVLGAEVSIGEVVVVDSDDAGKITFDTERGSNEL